MKRFAWLLLALAPAGAHAQVFLGEAAAIDGDTLSLGGEPVRLHGIDALEVGQTCTRGGQIWPCGNDAKQLLAQLVAGKAISCEQRDRDKYGRIVAYCRAGQIDLAEAMITGGYAIALPQFSSAYVEAESRVRTLGLGIWAGQFETPAAYRAAHPQLDRLGAPGRPVSQRSPPTAQASRSAPRAQGSAYFRYCSEARAAGAAPLYRGKPGYGPHLDRDGDGVACEPYRGR